MKASRRAFLNRTAKTSALALLAPNVSVARAFAADDTVQVVKGKFPTEQELWKGQLFMNGLGPRYTGNGAHRRFEKYLTDELTAIGLPPEHLKYTLPRWDAKRWALSVTSRDGSAKNVPVTSYYPYSGKTGPTGVTGDLVYAGTTKAPKLDGDLKGKILYLEGSPQPIELAEFYPTVYGIFNPGGNTSFPDPGSITFHADISGPLLENARKAGAAGIILSWSNVSDESAAYLYEPFSRAFADIPTLWVGKNAGTDLKRLAAAGAKTTLTLDAEIFPDSPTETLISTLPGVSDEVIIVHTHTDGPNAVEENGPIAVLALAKYFSRLPKSDRQRTLVFVLATGHMAEPYTPSSAWLKERPEIVRKAVAGICIEHLGCREWMDDPSGTHYRATGQNLMAWAFCPRKPEADILLKALEGTGAGRVAVVDPGQRFFGLGNALHRAGVPEIGYIARPNYLLKAPPNGCIEKVDSKRMHAETLAFAKTIHQIDRTAASVLKGTAA